MTHLLNLLLYLGGGYGGNDATTLGLQAQMLIPAWVAFILQVFAFKERPIYRLHGPTRWFFYGYLAYALIQLGIAARSLFISNQTYQPSANVLVQHLLVVVLLFLVLLRPVAGKEVLPRARLAGGRLWHYITFGTPSWLLCCCGIVRHAARPPDLRQPSRSSPETGQ